jgi:cation:H+ antiporter
VSLAIILVEFAACSGVVLFTGVRLSRYGDIIAEKTGLGGTWVGLLMVAVVTSLPELTTGTSAVAVFGVTEIAAGDAIGSCLFNLVILACLDFWRPTPLSASIHQGHVLTAGFGIVLMGLAAVSVFVGGAMPSIGWVGVPSLLFLAIYLLSMRTIFRFERARLSAVAEELTGDIRYRDVSLRQAVWAYAGWAAVLVSAAALLPGIGEALAGATGMAHSFVGSLFVATSTSLPEMAVSIAAMRLGALDMAAANLFGSNLFNMAVLGLDDVVYTQGPLLASVSSVHAVSLVAAMIMTAIAVIGLTYRAQRKRLLLSWDAVAMIAVYALAVTLLWRQSP